MKRRREDDAIRDAIRRRAQALGDQKKSRHDQFRLVDNPLPVPFDNKYTCLLTRSKTGYENTIFCRVDKGAKGRRLLRNLTLRSDLIPEGTRLVRVTLEFLKEGEL